MTVVIISLTLFGVLSSGDHRIDYTPEHVQYNHNIQESHNIQNHATRVGDQLLSVMKRVPEDGNTMTIEIHTRVGYAILLVYHPSPFIL